MKIVISRADGGVSVMTLIGDASPAVAIAKWQAAHPGEYVGHREMADSAVPADRSQREAWRDTTPEPVIDIDAAAALANAKAAAAARINTEAGAARAKYITVTAGQEATYLDKEREAAVYAGNPGGSYPYLAAEATATGTTVAAVADLVNATAAQWRGLNAQIEGKRRGALVAIEAAPDVAAVNAVFPIAWP